MPDGTLCMAALTDIRDMTGGRYTFCCPSSWKYEILMGETGLSFDSIGK